MINASQEFKKLIKKGTKLVNYADITLKDGTVLNLGPSDFSVGGFSMTDKTSNGKFEIGTAIAKTITVTIANHTNKFSSYDFYNSIIYIYVAIEKEDGTILKERKGKYYVINPTTPNDTIKLSGVDSMHLFDKPYNANTQFPATLLSILSDCCMDCGVNIGFGEFYLWNLEVKEKPKDCTYRQVVSWVAQVVCSNARISNDDYLELVWYDTSASNTNNIQGGNFILYDEEYMYDGGDFLDDDNSQIIDGGDFTEYYPTIISKVNSLNISTDDVVITGIKIEYDKKETFFGTDGYVVNIKDNPLVKGNEHIIGEFLSFNLLYLSFRPLSCQIANNPLFEPYDSCYVYDRKGNGYFTLINNVSFSINGFTTLSCNADPPIRNESSYISESAKAIAQANRNTEEQISNYDKAVQNMNLLAANSMGLYREYQENTDGSIFYYMSNRPIIRQGNVISFEENSVVYKMTGDGFFVSTDGGLSYTAGFDSHGNAIVNVLSAIGITFDWAKGGTLSLGGDNNINGSMVVYDAENNIVGKFNKDGLWAENGYFKGTIESTNATITGGTINIESASQDFSSIRIKYGIKSTGITPSYIYVENGSYRASMSDVQIQIGDLFNNAYLTSEHLLISSSTNITTIGANSSTFGGDIRFLGDCAVSGKCTVKGNITLGETSTDILVKAPTTFKSEIILQPSYSEVFKVNTSGNITTSGTLEVGGQCTLNGDCSICNSTSDKLSFFGGTKNAKQTVSTITSTTSATSTTNASKINEIINALKKYNLL